MRFFKKVSVISMVLALSFVFLSNAQAEEKKSENSVTGFFRRLFNYPVKATQKTGEMTANTLNNAGEKVLAKAGENTAQTLQGDLAEAPKILVEPAIGAAETTGQTAVETVQIPVQAAQE